MGILICVAILGALGLLFGCALGFAAVKFKVEEDPRVELVREALPGANCGGCGFPGCDGLAFAIANGSAKANGCPVGGESVAAKISDIMGVNLEKRSRVTAYVKCAGSESVSARRYEYSGLEDCGAQAKLAGGGPKSCSYGCLGAGNCVVKCQFDALKVVDGVAVVDKEKCVACGQCVDACPKNLISLIPYEAAVKVACSSKDFGKPVRDACSVGCIGCRICEKICPLKAAHVNDNLAEIDYDACRFCLTCVGKCPTKAIQSELIAVDN
ncbi:MAG: RnfABCDGE type electron transport complex subunit B [Clostridiales bacterium]|jgi:electron transport complex protein RnfB|nr:RnfABCDGE type electron transport complex subunit B [Clostridiales bacterium]